MGKRLDVPGTLAHSAAGIKTMIIDASLYMVVEYNGGFPRATRGTLTLARYILRLHWQVTQQANNHSCSP